MTSLCHLQTAVHIGMTGSLCLVFLLCGQELRDEGTEVKKDVLVEVEAEEAVCPPWVGALGL